MRISASVVWPVSAPPILDGAILVDDRGRIARVAPRATLSAPAGTHTLDFGDAVLTPGLINAHTHLELHGLRAAVPDSDFYAWIQHLRQLKEATTYAEFTEAARVGLHEAWSHGQTTVADTGTTGATVVALAALGGHGIYYQEVIAPDAGRGAEMLAEGHETVEQLRQLAPPGVRIGLSPHAPYTVSPALARQTAELGRRLGVPLAGHVAESDAEWAFVTEGGGPFGALWRERGLALPEPARSPVAYAEGLGLLGSDFLAIHAVRADAADLEVLARTRTPVAVCPRSNRRHGHGDPPLAAMLLAGLRLGLGTDSVASVETLDLIAEARAARDLAGCTAEQAMRLITEDAAGALGLRGAVGALEPGLRADVCVLEVPTRSPEAELLAGAILEAGSPAVRATVVAGRVVYDESS